MPRRELKRSPSPVPLSRAGLLGAALPVILLLASCGGGDGSAGGSTRNAPGPTTATTAIGGDIDPADLVVPVEPVAATTGAVTGVIGPDAPLVLETVGPDGATFRAEFVAGASVFPVTVTMRPLDRLDGMDGTVEAVSFEPEGVFLVEPGVLTIDGPVANEPDSRGFGYHATADGPVASPETVVPVSGPLQVVIGHFSGYGAASESPPQWDISTISAAEAHEIIALASFSITNSLHLLKSGDLNQAEADAAINSAYDAIGAAARRLGTAAIDVAAQGNPDAASQIAIQEATNLVLRSERASHFAGNETGRNAVQEFIVIMDAYFKGVSKHCQKLHDLTVLLLLNVLRHQLAVMGGYDPQTDTEFDKCVTAEVRFDTSITHEIIDGGDEGVYATGEIGIEAKVTVNLFDRDPSEVVPYTPISTLTTYFPHCARLDILSPGTFAVQRASLIAAPPPPAPPAGTATTTPPTGPDTVPLIQISDASVRLTIDAIVVTNPGGACEPDPETSQPLSEIFDALHPDEAMGGGTYLFEGGYEIPGQGSEVLARRTITREVVVGNLANDIFRSTTVIEIVHTPA